MTNETIGIYDHSKGENIIREMTDTEQTVRDAEVAEFNAKQTAKSAEDEAVETAKLEATQKLIELGIDPKALGL